MFNSKSRRTRFPSFITLALLLVVYVLSLGPVLALYSTNLVKGPIPKPLATFYVPAHWLREHTGMGRPLSLHDDWWKNVLRRK